MILVLRPYFLVTGDATKVATKPEMYKTEVNAART
jgi:hypothetical protein